MHLLIPNVLTAPLAVTAAAFLVFNSSSLAQQHTCSNHQTDARIAARIDRLIQQMTISERVAQLQDRAPAIPRLGLPAYNWWNEGLHGIARNGVATVFPQAIGLAATWDQRLLHAVGDTVSTEARAKFAPHARTDSPRYGGLTIWSPNINIFRDPRWGRGQETYGEDPFLTATLGTQFVEGIQGDDPFYFKAQATPKHFVAHSGPESGRDSFNAVVSAHDLADTYLPAFHALLTRAGAAALMCSYNAINATPSCANQALLQDVVSDRWRFNGYVVSDCDAVGNIFAYHHFAADPVHAAAAALNAGVDLDCGNSYLPLEQALEQHLVTEAAIDASLHRLLQARLQLGLLDPEGCSPYDRISPAANDTPQHRALALRAAEESIVLLKNDGVLPLQPSTRIAVIGPNADAVKILEANYHGTASAPVTPLDGLLKAFGNVRYAQGSLDAAGIFAPVPRTVFTTSANSPGLNAEFFDSPSFAGTPAVSLTVPNMDYDLSHTSPSPLLRSAQYAARWSGFFTPPAAGDYILRVNTDRCGECALHDRFRLLLDGRPILEADGSKAAPDRATMHFADASPHAFQLELVHQGEDGGMTFEWQPPAGALLDQAVATAQSADAVILVAGLSPDLEGEALPVHIDGFDGGDRTSLDLPATQRALLARLAALHKPTILVLTSGSALALGPQAASANAILEAWYPGEEGGTALAHILTGKTSPSGRLPVTFYRTVGDLPAFTDYSMAHRTYRYFTGAVEFPFGFGLSYARFRYGAVRVLKPVLGAGEPLHASVTLTNTSAFSASEVAELYLVPPQVTGAPRLALAGFERVALGPGQSRTLHFTLTEDQLSTVDPSGHRAVRAGRYRVLIAGTQPDPAAVAGASFRITSRPARPRGPQPEPDRDLPGIVAASFHASARSMITR